MIRIIQYILFGTFLLNSTNGFSQSTNTVELNIQFYDQGICYPMEISSKYPSSQHLKTKTILQSSAYYSTLYAEVISKDTADLKPQSNHELQASSMQFNPELTYELIVYKYNGFDRSEPEAMVIKISKLKNDTQLIIPFKKGDFDLQEMEFFKELETNSPPKFKSIEDKEIKNKLKLDSTAYFSNGSIKANYYIVADNFPLYFVKEFDSINRNSYAQGLSLLTNYNLKLEQPYKTIWEDSGNTKYGYWEYFENGKRIKHELWASAMSHQYIWYSSGILKSSMEFGRTNNTAKYTYYLENGLIKEQSIKVDKTRQYIIKSNIYSSNGTLIQINTFKSLDGYTKHDLYKREIFYPSGKIKMEEILEGSYNIKYFNEDGTTKSK
ncbi:hypothetical protein ERX46_10345 [Brumimicrobium glaciale]|uniref:MORN repeat variant n=1 Tax=Brumimicrobium glaciale TaxID=200475 RepID=A0A4Q4KJH0_9FLAO|nr:hypothetical protein [Brumimicrobium glaciale]RYM33335.1 hypothetical protein ERX46_10345 [Brumimicrobium glaciale]